MLHSFIILLHSAYIPHCILSLLFPPCMTVLLSLHASPPHFHSMHIFLKERSHGQAKKRYHLFRGSMMSIELWYLYDTSMMSIELWYLWQICTVCNITDNWSYYLIFHLCVQFHVSAVSEIKKKERKNTLYIITGPCRGPKKILFLICAHNLI